MTTYVFISEYILTAKIFLPLMVFILSSAILGKFALFYLKRGSLYFTNEFSVRVRRHLRGEYPESFRKGPFDTIRFLTNKTHDDIFELRRLNQRRRYDKVKVFLDSLFMIDEGAHIFFDDLADQVSYIGQQEHVNWESFVKFIFSKNPIFNHLFGVISIHIVEMLFKRLPLYLFLLGAIGAVFSYTAGGWIEPLFLGSVSYVFMSIVNIVLNTERYDDVVLKTFSWSMFLLWSNRCEVSHYTTIPNRPEDENEDDSLFGGETDFSLVTEETLNLIPSDDEIPDIPSAA